MSIDIDAIRSYPTVGPETVAALCDEVERLRDQHARFRDLAARNVANLTAELDAAYDRLDKGEAR